MESRRDGASARRDGKVLVLHSAGRRGAHCCGARESSRGRGQNRLSECVSDPGIYLRQPRGPAKRGGAAQAQPARFRHVGEAEHQTSNHLRGARAKPQPRDQRTADMSVATPEARPSPRTRPPRFDDPVVDPALTIASMTDRVCAIALRERPYLWWWIAFVPCMALTLLLVA